MDTGSHLGTLPEIDMDIVYIPSWDLNLSSLGPKLIVTDRDTTTRRNPFNHGVSQ